MDLILDLLKGLAAALTPSQFILVLVIIVAVSASIIIFFINGSHSKNGMFSFLNSSSSAGSDDIKDLTAKIETLLLLSESNTSQIVDAILNAREENKMRGESSTEKISIATSLIKNELSKVAEDMFKGIEEMKYQLKTHDIHDQQVIENLKLIMQQTQDSIRQIANQLEKIDNYVRDQIPDFKADNKEFGRELNDLSRDIALIERSIQSQLNTVNAVKLR